MKRTTHADPCGVGSEPDPTGVGVWSRGADSQSMELDFDNERAFFVLSASLNPWEPLSASRYHAMTPSCLFVT
jgi:hypothetical protein